MPSPMAGLRAVRALRGGRKILRPYRWGGIEDIEDIEAIDKCLVKIFWWVCGGGLKEMKATLMLRKESLHLSFETNGYIPMQPINSTTQGNLD